MNEKQRELTIHYLDQGRGVHEIAALIGADVEEVRKVFRAHHDSKRWRVIWSRERKR